MSSDRYNYVDSTRLQSVPVGEWVSYFPDGKVHTKSYYDDGGQPIGRWVRLFSDGRLEETEKYDDQGHLEFRDHYEYGKAKLGP